MAGRRGVVRPEDLRAMLTNQPYYSDRSHLPRRAAT